MKRDIRFDLVRFVKKGDEQFELQKIYSVESKNIRGKDDVTHICLIEYESRWSVIVILIKYQILLISDFAKSEIEREDSEMMELLSFHLQNEFKIDMEDILVQIVDTQKTKAGDFSIETLESARLYLEGGDFYKIQ